MNVARYHCELGDLEVEVNESRKQLRVRFTDKKGLIYQLCKFPYPTAAVEIKGGRVMCEMTWTLKVVFELIPFEAIDYVRELAAIRAERDALIAERGTSSRKPDDTHRDVVTAMQDNK